jgi:hypothetical protein
LLVYLSFGCGLVTCFLKNEHVRVIYAVSLLGGIMMSVFAIEPKVSGFKPGRGDGVLRAMKIRSTLLFGGEVKLSASCRKIVRHVKELCEHERDII